MLQNDNPYVAPVSCGEPPAPATSRPAVFQWPFVVLVIAWTILAIYVANGDRSWGAFGIAIIYGPTVNGTIVLAAVIYGVLRKLANRQASVSVPILTVFLWAIVSCMVIFGAIFSMDLHGC